MSERIRTPASKPVNLASYSPIVQMIMRDRSERGNKTLYDTFLCEYSGDPRRKQYSRPLEYRGPSGRTYGYNNPHLHITSFTHQGILLDIRHARGTLEEEDATAEYLIASADLRRGTISKWQVQSIGKHHRRDGGIIEITLSEPRYDGPYPMAEFQKKQLEQARTLGRLTLHQNYGNVFMEPDLVRQDMHDLADLVDTVNVLTDHLGIRLDR